MYVQLLRSYDAAGHKVNLVDPDWDQIEEHIRQLDGNDRYELRLLPAADNWQAGDAVRNIHIVGGADNRYLCTFSDEDDHFAYPTETGEDDTEEIFLQAGEYSDQYERKYIVGIETTLVAAKTFAANGSLNTSIEWIG